MATTCSQAHRLVVEKGGRKGRIKRKTEQEQMIPRIPTLTMRRSLGWRRQRGCVGLARSVRGMLTAVMTSPSCLALQTPSQTQTMTESQSSSESLIDMKYISILYWYRHWHIKQLILCSSCIWIEESLLLCSSTEASSSFSNWMWLHPKLPPDQTRPVLKKSTAPMGKWPWWIHEVKGLVFLF